MKATEFVKKYGWDKAKTHLAIMDAENWHNEFFNDLQTLVNAYELVESIGGLEKAKFKVRLNNASFLETSSDLKQAIADVESCL